MTLDCDTLLPPAACLLSRTSSNICMHLAITASTWQHEGVSAQAGYLVSAHKGRRPQAAARELPEDVAIQARPARVQDHICVHMAVRMVPFLWEHTSFSAAASPCHPGQHRDIYMR